MKDQTSIQQKQHVRTVFDAMPSAADLPCKIAAAQGASEKEIAQVRQQFSMFDFAPMFLNQ